MRRSSRVPPNYPHPGDAQSNTESSSTLFMDSTISRDDTVGDASLKKDVLSKLTNRPGNEPQLTGPPQQSVPTRATPADTPERKSSTGSSSNSSNESDASSGELDSIWPDIKANEKAHWRRKARAKRAILDGVAGMHRPNPNEDFGIQVHRDTEENTNGPERHSGTIVAKSTAKERLGPSKTSTLDSASLIRTASDAKDVCLSNEQDQKQISQGLKTAPGTGDTIRYTSAASGVFSVCPDRMSRGSNTSPADLAGYPHDRALGELRPTMAENLHAITEKFLNIDVLDERRDLSRFIAYLLDTIDLLATRNTFLEAKDTDSGSESSCSESEPPPSRPSSGHTDMFVGKVLYRVICSIRRHHHNYTHYEDKPTYKDPHSGDDAKLTGDKIVHSLEDYVDELPNICFLVINEISCSNTDKHEDHTDGPDHRQTSGHTTETIQIVAPLLQKALRQVAEYDPGPHIMHPWQGFQPGIRAPYPFLFHHHEGLVELAQDETYKDILSPLLEFLATNYREEYTEAKSLFNRGMVTADHVSKLFKLGQMVVARKDSNARQAYILTGCVPHSRGRVNLMGWSWMYNGKELNRRQWSRVIDVPDEQTQIVDLEIHPVEFARAEDIMYLEARGRKFWDMMNQAYLCYTGWDKDGQYHYTEERFMVDVATYNLLHHPIYFSHRTVDAPAGGAVDEVVRNQKSAKLDPWPSKVNKTEELSAKMLMLLPSTIFGFRLQAKKWINLHVDNFHTIKWNPKAFERLVLDEAAKRMIYALIDVQKSAGKMDDIIAGKGNGLIILLHGSPGTGKTLTAESVAEIAEKPLYRVTCGDIGTDPKGVEDYLETVLYLGKTWDCVLLLDEADVFLEERTIADLQRNSLVSIFLRTLEYYDGILILTSNRVGTFDEAFKSRIQVAIHYDNLSKKSRKAIWRNFFDMIEESEDEDANMAELERRLDELAAHEMNGRQIRNALLTARQLAKHEGERLDWKHLSQAIKTASDFNKYLKTVKGHSDDQWAREEMLR